MAEFDDDDDSDIGFEPRWSAASIVRRVVIIAFALGFTGAAFYFWGLVGNAMHNYFETPTVAPGQTPGEVTVNVLPPQKDRPPRDPDCTGKASCPK